MGAACAKAVPPPKIPADLIEPAKVRRDALVFQIVPVSIKATPKGYKICSKETAKKFSKDITGASGTKGKDNVAVIGGSFKGTKFVDAAKGKDTAAFADKTIKNMVVVRVSKCEDGHNMAWVCGDPYGGEEYDGITCNRCGETYTEDTGLWHCYEKDCEKDYCPNCGEIKDGLKKEEAEDAGEPAEDAFGDDE